jgi:excinuclease ABC subunit C
VDLKEKVKNLPLSPGVYLMKDSLGEIIYVGKSKSLKNRVGSYFQNSKNRAPKIEKLVMNLKDFDYILTDTEFEAFLLECKLIKKIKPRYNKLMKSPRSYTYLKIKMDEIYPTLEVTSSRDENSNCTYFGPYTSKSTVERALEGIKICYKINCSNPSKKNSACLNYSLGLCLGMCLGDCTQEEYLKIINKILSFFNGNDNSLRKDLEEKMFMASEKFDFETAAKYRDYMDAVNVLINKEEVIGFTEENQNIAMIEYLSDYIIKLFLIKDNKILLSEKYNLENSDTENSDIIEISSIIKSNIFTYFKGNTLNPFTEVTKEEIDEAQIIYSYLKSSNCKYVIISDDYLEDENHDNIDKALKELLESR